MSEAESSEFRGAYKQLAPELIEKAYLENEAYDIHAQANVLESKASELQEELRIQYLEEIEALVDQEDMGHDEFLHAYQSAFLKLNLNNFEVHEFGRMMELRSKLAPGVLMQLPRGEIVTIAQPKDDTDPNYGIQPSLRRTDKGSRFREKVEFFWGVPIEESSAGLLIDRTVTVGAEAIAERLDGEYFRPVSGRIFEDKLPEQLINGAQMYEKIGQTDKAQRLREEAGKALYAFFDRKYFGNNNEFTYSSYHAVSTNFELLNELNPQAYEHLLDKLRVHAAKGIEEDKVRFLIKEHARQVSLSDAIAQNEETYSIPSPTEVAQLYAEFAVQGEALIAQEQEDAEETETEQ